MVWTALAGVMVPTTEMRDTARFWIQLLLIPAASAGATYGVVNQQVTHLESTQAEIKKAQKDLSDVLQGIRDTSTRHDERLETRKEEIGKLEARIERLDEAISALRLEHEKQKIDVDNLKVLKRALELERGRSP